MLNAKSSKHDQHEMQFYSVFARNPLSLLTQDSECQHCLLNQSNTGFDCCNREYSFDIDGNGGIIDVKDDATLHFIDFLSLECDTDILVIKLGNFESFNFIVKSNIYSVFVEL